MHTLRPGCQVAAGQVFGRAAGLSTTGCTKDAHAGLCVGKPEGFPIAPIPQQRLRMKFGQLIFASLHARRGGKCRFPRQGKTGGVVRGGTSLLACPERQGSGGIQPADGWAWFQGRHAFGLGFKGCSPLGGIRKGGSPCGAVQPPGGSGVQGTASESSWRGTSLAMYNLAIPPFRLLFFLAARGEVRRRHPAWAFLGACGVFFALREKPRNPALRASPPM